MTLSLLAARPIDFAIFFTMGGLWLFGAIFIVLVWRWILRFDANPDPRPKVSPTPSTARHRLTAPHSPSPTASDLLGV